MKSSNFKSQLEKLFEHASDAFIARMYDVPEQQIKNRRDDFGIKQLMNILNRIEREDETAQIFKEKLRIVSNEYNNGNNPHTNSTPLNSEKELIYMKATGIVRRIDDLGRIVIPKEIRRTMRIREGDPMEIFTSREGEILLKKYSPVGELGEFAVTLAESVAQTLGELVCVTDRDFVIAAAGTGKKEFEGKTLDTQMQSAIDKRCSQLLSGDKNSFVKIVPDDEKKYTRQAVATILSHGDCIGAVAILSSEKSQHQDETLLQQAKSIANFLGKHMEQ